MFLSQEYVFKMSLHTIFLPGDAVLSFSPPLLAQLLSELAGWTAVGAADPPPLARSSEGPPEPLLLQSINVFHSEADGFA